MARHEGELSAAAEVRLDVAALLEAMRARCTGGADRHDAIARYLSGAEGWRDAGQVLGGAFASPTGAPGEEQDR